MRSNVAGGAHIADTAKLADLLLAAGADVPPDIKTRIADIGFDFEFMRSGFNPELVDETSAGLDRLYAMFGVEPVQRRVMHDGVSPIIARSETWGDQHEELWNLLVPPMGHAATVQGEVVRIAGRINDEYLRNAWGNWDGNYKRMADAALVHLGSGMPLAPALLEEARTLVADIKSKRGDPLRLCELAVGWVALNPMPVKLPKPDYDR